MKLLLINIILLATLTIQKLVFNEGFAQGLDGAQTIKWEQFGDKKMQIACREHYECNLIKDRGFYPEMLD